MVYLVGAGPGDPELVTVRGKRLLGEAEVVLFDALSHPGLLAFASPDAELRDVGKRGGKKSPSQEWITDQLIALAQEGKKIVRLKGGDSYLFARGAEEAEALVAANIPFEVVPGICSPVGTSAFAGIPLTHRDVSSSVTFITGTDRRGNSWSDEAWKKLATATDTLCILMGMRALADITRAIQEGGRSPETPVAIVMWAARPQQRVVEGTLANIAEKALEAKISNPAVIVVGEVCQYRESLRWFDNRPLFGKRVLVPRAVHQAAETARYLREAGAEPVLIPLIDIQPLTEAEYQSGIDQQIAELNRFDAVVFTSENAVRRFFERLGLSGRDSRALGLAKIAVIGTKTAKALKAHGIRADIIAKNFVGEELTQALLDSGCQRFLIPRASEAREFLPDTLKNAGRDVVISPVYRTVSLAEQACEELNHRFDNEGIDWCLLTSASMVHALLSAVGRERLLQADAPKLACIGPITAEALGSYGIKAAVVADKFTVPDLLERMMQEILLETTDHSLAETGN